MQTNPKKVKFLISLAIFIAVVLLVVSFFLIIKINIAKNTIEKQNKQIAELQKQIDFNNKYSENSTAQISPIIIPEVQL